MFTGGVWSIGALVRLLHLLYWALHIPSYLIIWWCLVSHSLATTPYFLLEYLDYFIHIKLLSINRILKTRELTPLTFYSAVVQFPIEYTSDCWVLQWFVFFCIGKWMHFFCYVYCFGLCLMWLSRFTYISIELHIFNWYDNTLRFDDAIENATGCFCHFFLFHFYFFF